MEDTYLIIPDLIEDERGFFYESWNQENFNKLINRDIDFVQENHSRSKHNVLRGFHYQLPPYAQAKLVRCILGEIFDVVIDLRINSKTFMDWVGVELNNKNHYQLWVPEGFAHGFFTLSKNAEVLYKVNQYWKKNSEISLYFDDPDLKIDWPFDISEVYLSEKDKKSYKFSELSPDKLFP